MWDVKTCGNTQCPAFQSRINHLLAVFQVIMHVTVTSCFIQKKLLPCLMFNGSLFPLCRWWHPLSCQLAFSYWQALKCIQSGRKCLLIILITSYKYFAYFSFFFSVFFLLYLLLVPEFNISLFLLRKLVAFWSVTNYPWWHPVLDVPVGTLWKCRCVDFEGIFYLFILNSYFILALKKLIKTIILPTTACQ